ncbi:TonB-dependent siderophore receptor [Leptolyngbyaceae cyanobacterium UHCC 1019]
MNGRQWALVQLVVWVAIGVATDVKADETDGGGVSASSVSKSVANISRVRDLQQPATTVKDWVAQMGAAQVQVTNVKLERTEAGLDIVLETAEGKPLTIDATKFRTEGNSLIAEIPNAVLALPQGQPFVADNPTADIATVQMEQQAGNIRVSVAGNNALPKTEVTLKAGGLAYSLNPEADEPDEEIVVTGEGQQDFRVPNATTGTRLDIPLLDTPASIGVITNQLIEDTAPRRVEDLAPYISGVAAGDVGQGGLFTDFQIRGFSTGSQVYINGLRDNYRSLVRDLSNIERIEILKGFSSILYGAGTPGGVVNYITKKPQATPSYEVSFEAGSFDFYRGEADLTGPLTSDKNLLYRLNLAFQGAQSFVPNVEDNRIYVAPSLTLKTGGGGSLTVEGEYYRQDKDFNTGAKFFNDRFFYNRSYTDPRNSQIYNHYRIATYFDQPISKQWSINLSGQYFNTQRELQPLLTSIFFDGDILPRFYRTISDDYYQYNLRGEVRGNFKIGASEHKLLAGVEFNKYRSRFDSAISVFGSVDVANPTFDVPLPTGLSKRLIDFSNKDWGIYIQDFVKLGRFRLLAGLRYGEFEFFDQGKVAQSGNFVSPSVGLVYSLTDSASLYASFSQSTEPQFGLSADGSPVAPRKATQFEIGAKVNLLNDRVSVTAALFNLKQTNIAETDPVTDASILVGDVRSRGFELDIAGKITKNFNLIAAYTLLDSEVTSSISGLQGNRSVNSPRHSLGLYGKYEFTEGGLKGLSLSTGLIYAGERSGDSENTFELPGYVRVDLGAGYKINNVTFRLAVENLFNERYASGSSSRASITQGLPLAITGKVSVEF